MGVSQAATSDAGGRHRAEAGEDDFGLLAWRTDRSRRSVADAVLDLLLCDGRRLVGRVVVARRHVHDDVSDDGKNALTGSFVLAASHRHAQLGICLREVPEEQFRLRLVVHGHVDVVVGALRPPVRRLGEERLSGVGGRVGNHRLHDHGVPGLGVWLAQVLAAEPGQAFLVVNGGVTDLPDA